MRAAYEIMINGRRVDPMKVKLPRDGVLPSDARHLSGGASAQQHDEPPGAPGRPHGGADQCHRRSNPQPHAAAASLPLNVRPCF